MKNEEQTLNQQNSQEVQMNSQQPSTANCSQGNKADLVCCNKNCSFEAFLCTSKTCKCNQNHLKCPKMLIDSVKDPIAQKIIPVNLIEDFVLKRIDETIDKLSDFREAMSHQIKSKLQYYGLSMLEIKFYYALNKKTKQTPTGKNIFEMLAKTMEKQSQPLDNQFFKNVFLDSWNKVQTQIESIKTSLVSFLSTFNIQNELQGANVFSMLEFKNSKIIKTDQDEKKLLKMFQPKYISAVQLMYRGSQHEFKMQKFMARHKHDINTIAICETQNGKVIGGYTPLSREGFGPAKDHTGQSFIFSLTNNHKFILDKSKTALFKGNGVSFGDMHPDFSISDQANKNDCISRINRSYLNQNYVRLSDQSYFEFNGDPRKTFLFKVKEWEVYQVFFKQ